MMKSQINAATGLPDEDSMKMLNAFGDQEKRRRGMDTKSTCRESISKQEIEPIGIPLNNLGAFHEAIRRHPSAVQNN
jgi:hypothetical protein